MMDKIDKEFFIDMFFFSIGIVFIGIILIIFFGFVSININDGIESFNCEKYENYGYLVELEDNGFFKYDNCYIIMQDGTKVLSDDFNIADYKKPMVMNDGK
jgi:hypothetical protein